MKNDNWRETPLDIAGPTMDMFVVQTEQELLNLSNRITRVSGPEMDTLWNELEKVHDMFKQVHERLCELENQPRRRNG
tara:strand:+ start:572 stop:805 length:234 start_codon:yes stop_codon:yes gene_type:complete